MARLASLSSMAPPALAREARQIALLLAVAAAWLALTLCPVPGASSAAGLDVATMAAATGAEVDALFRERGASILANATSESAPIRVDAMAAALTRDKLQLAADYYQDKLHQPASALPIPAMQGRREQQRASEADLPTDWPCSGAQLTGAGPGGRPEGDAGNMATLFVAGVLTKCMSRFLMSNQIVWMAAA